MPRKNGPQIGRTPKKELQLLYDLAIRALKNPNYSQIRDEETGEMLGDDKALFKAVAKIQETFQLEKRE